MSDVKERVHRLCVRLRESNQALDDWLTTYAPEFHKRATVKVAKKRIYDNGGTLAYVTMILQRNNQILAELERE